MKLSTFYEHVIEAADQKDMSVEDIFKIIKEQGILGLEVDLDRLLQKEADTEKGDRLLQLMADTGLSVSCIYGFYDMAHKDEKERIERHIALAKQSKAERVMPIPGFFSDEEVEQLAKIPKEFQAFSEFYDQNDSVQKHILQLQYLVNYAKSTYPELKVTLEDFDAHNSPIATIWGLRYYLEHVEGLYYTLDCGNLAFSDENILEALDVLGKYIAHVHCKDRGEEPDNPQMKGKYLKGLLPVPVGKGYIPFDIILKRLKQMNYHGYYAIEHFGAEDQLGFLRESVKFLTEMK